MDLLTMLDLFLPLQVAMIAVQGFSVAPWKCVKYMDLLFEHYDTMDFQARRKVPLLLQHEEEVAEKKFKSKDIYIYIYRAYAGTMS